ncbi:MAG: hypothetical protein M9964_00435 [Solirubrobacterales bacterium]|nr:hypothetical protein [Solirubrobacterales bacterium]
MEEPQAGQDPGWYPYFNGVRFFDGQEWSDQIAFHSQRGRAIQDELRAIRSRLDVLVIWFVVLPLAIAIIGGVVVLLIGYSA